MCALVVDRRSAEAPVRNLSKASVNFLAPPPGPHVKLPTEMSNFPTLGGPPGANVKVSRGTVKVYAWLGPYYPPHARRAILRQPLEKVCTYYTSNYTYGTRNPGPFLANARR